MEEIKTAAPAAHSKEIQVPEWEHEISSSAPTAAPKRSPLTTIRSRYTIFMATNKRTCGLTRRMLCLICLILFILILALAIGLGVGLSRAQSVSAQTTIPKRPEMSEVSNTAVISEMAKIPERMRTSWYPQAPSFSSWIAPSQAEVHPAFVSPMSKAPSVATKPAKANHHVHSSSSKAQNLPLPSNSQTFTGDLTYYGTGVGACGIDIQENDYIVAVSKLVFDAAGSSSATGGNSNANPLCGRKIRAMRYNTAVGEQRSVDLTVVDRCEACQATDLDTSLGVFEQMASVDQGRVDVTWAWLPAS